MLLSDYREIREYRTYIGENLFNYLIRAIQASQKGAYIESCIQSAKLLEGFFKKLSVQLGLESRAKETLEFLIGKIRKTERVPELVLDQAKIVQVIRNSTSHEQEYFTEAEQTHAETLLTAMRQILDWYTNEFSAQLVRPLVTETAGTPIFISALTPHNLDQAVFIDMLADHLPELGLRGVRLTGNLYNMLSPLERARKVIGACRGAIILGLERSHAVFVVDKENSEHHGESTHRRYTTSWSHLEAGIAYGLGLPMFVACQDNIFSDGVFDRKYNTFQVHSFTTLNIPSREFTRLLREIREWSVDEGLVTQ